MKTLQVPNLNSRSISRARTRAIKSKTKGMDSPYKDTGLILVGEFSGGGPLLKDPNNERYFGLEAAVKEFLSKNETVEVSFENPISDNLTIDLIKINDLNLDERLFVPIKTGKFIDGAFSSQGGIFPGTNYMINGDPGIGKTTVCLDILNSIRKEKRVLFISAEMNEIDMFGYAARINGFGEIPTLYLSNYTDKDTREVIKKTLAQGWDLVLIDSATELCEDLRSHGMSAKEADSWIIDQMTSNNKANNNEKIYTSFIVIQQVGKSGQFVGSNKWKHNTTGMIELRFMDDERYAIITKNRRGFQYDKICFNIQSDEVVYREDMYHIALQTKELDQSQKDQLEKDNIRFNELFMEGMKDQKEKQSILQKEADKIDTKKSTWQRS